MFAGFGDSFHDLLCNFGFERAGGQIVHEKHGGRALHGNVVDAVVHQVATHGVMHLHLKGDFQLRAHAVHTGNKHGVEVFLVHGKQAPETANLAQHTPGEGLVGEVLDSLLGLVGAVDVDAGIGVGDRVALGVGVLSHFSVRRCRVGRSGAPGRRNRFGASNSSTSGIEAGAGARRSENGACRACGTGVRPPSQPAGAGGVKLTVHEHDQAQGTEGASSARQGTRRVALRGAPTGCHLQPPHGGRNRSQRAARQRGPRRAVEPGEQPVRWDGVSGQRKARQRARHQGVPHG